MTIIVARRLLESSTATLSSTSARLLEASAPEPQPYCSYTLHAQPAATSTFNSNVFVPSISSDLYGGPGRGQVSSKYCGF